MQAPEQAQEEGAKEEEEGAEAQGFFWDLASQLLATAKEILDKCGPQYGGAEWHEQAGGGTSTCTTPLSFSLSLSLSTHTHTHTHTGVIPINFNICTHIGVYGQGLMEAQDRILQLHANSNLKMYVQREAVDLLLKDVDLAQQVL